jgi:hypothetical protein
MKENKKCIKCLWYWNKDIEFDKKMKEKVEVGAKKLVNDKYVELKHFIKLLKVDKNIIIDLSIILSMKRKSN